eukprot:CAMPEP_0185788678 /NCGR_PEP_ID=MMETSP1174-20130828/147285_1 /TAXON_ID=35687 /ORGANISM="Dictyocha speculum, Strain CCMP1381" /LENGTH=179 /DNA_ID=CAMNT_0028482467 /DNA_START=461 /DNA_END=1000 /DNA_ORIENTATION=+
MKLLWVRSLRSECPAEPSNPGSPREVVRVRPKSSAHRPRHCRRLTGEGFEGGICDRDIKSRACDHVGGVILLTARWRVHVDAQMPELCGGGLCSNCPGPLTPIPSSAPRCCIGVCLCFEELCLQGRLYCAPVKCEILVDEVYDAPGSPGFRKMIMQRKPATLGDLFMLKEQLRLIAAFK